MSGTSQDKATPETHEEVRHLARQNQIRAQSYMIEEYLSVAEKLLAASRALLEVSGGINGEEGVWLLTAEAHVPIVQNKPDEALEVFRQALKLAEETFSKSHYVVAVCLHNLGETYFNLGKAKEAEPLYARAQPIIEAALSAVEVGDDHASREYFQAAHDEIATIYAKVREALSDES